MSTKKRKNSNLPNQINFKDKLYGAMLAIVVGIMPLIVQVVARPVPPDIRWLKQVDIIADSFVFWKSVFITVPAIVIAFYFITDFFTSKNKIDLKPYFKRPQVILSLGYLLFVLISAVASRYPYTAWFGTFHREEGALMWIVYFVVFAAAMFYVREPKYTKPILYGLTFSSIIMGLIGVSQLIDRDFFDTAFAEWLITLGVTVEEFGTVFTMAHGTLFNPNTFGKYTAMVAPVLLLSGLVYDGKRYIKTLMLLGGALMLVGVFASSSLGGLVGIVSATGVLVVTYVCNFVYRKVKSEDELERANVGRIGLMFGGVAVAVVLSLIFVPPLNSRVTTLFTRLQEAAAAETSTQERFVFDGDSVFVYRGEDKLFSMTVHTLDPAADNWMTVRDGSGQEVLPIVYTPLTATEAGVFTFNVPGFREVFVQRFTDGFSVRHGGQFAPFILTLYDGRIFGFMHNFETKVDFARPVPAWGFEGRETWGSSRGYLWSRSFPLMPRRAIIGSGPDTFINVFPQHDLVGLQLAFNNPYQIVDKAHNLFIQTWVSTGGASAILLFALFAHYLFTAFVGVVKSKGVTLFNYGLRLGLLAGISGFVMSSMATDSTIGSTGVFFVLLGMGYGVNEYVKKSRLNPQLLSPTHPQVKL
ncbi:MAG: O-antigen ligase family protein [Firmicutes bacterium]|nr:O-antigen ligase family protein [Bacillota bacterium]